MANTAKSPVGQGVPTDWWVGIGVARPLLVGRSKALVALLGPTVGWLVVELVPLGPSGFFKPLVGFASSWVGGVRRGFAIGQAVVAGWGVALSDWLVSPFPQPLGGAELEEVEPAGDLAASACRRPSLSHTHLTPSPSLLSGPLLHLGEGAGQWAGPNTTLPSCPSPLLLQLLDGPKFR